MRVFELNCWAFYISEKVLTNNNLKLFIKFEKMFKAIIAQKDFVNNWFSAKIAIIPSISFVLPDAFKNPWEFSIFNFQMHLSFFYQKRRWCRRSEQIHYSKCWWQKQNKKQKTHIVVSTIHIHSLRSKSEIQK